MFASLTPLTSIWCKTCLLGVRQCRFVHTVGDGVKPKSWWKEPAHGVAFLETLRESLQLHSPTDWSRVTHKQIFQLGGRGFLKEHQSLHNALQILKPDCAWDFFVEGRYPSNHWRQVANQREFLNRIREKYGINKLSDWKKITWADIERHGGHTLRKLYANFPDMLRGAYPELTIDDVEVREKLPQGFWDDPRHRQQFLERVKSQHEIRSLSDWNRVSTRDLMEMGGSGLLAKYSSLEEMLRGEMPHEDWESLELRSRVPAGYWTEERMREHMEHVGNKLGVKTLDDWSRVTVQEFKEASGDRGYQSQFRTFFDLLQAVYPHHDWDALCRQRAPHSYWQDPKNQRRFLDKFAIEHGIECPQDWKRVTYAQIEHGGGRSLLRLYPSILHMLEANYPEHPWSLTDRQTISGKYWKEAAHRARLIEEVERKFLITEPQDWYRISWKQLQTVRAASYIKRNGGLCHLLQQFYPHVEWQPALFSARDKRSSQRALFTMVSELFPDEEVVEEYLHEQLTRESGRPVEFDVFLPHRAIAFEYQGEHHFRDIPAMGTLELCRARDQEKIELCQAHDIQLYHIPYWWDGTVDHIRTFVMEKNSSPKE